MSKFEYIQFNQIKTASELLADRMVNKLKNVEGTELVTNDLQEFHDKSRVESFEGIESEMLQTFTSSFELGKLKYINVYGTKNVPVLEKALEELTKGYDIKELESYSKDDLVDNRINNKKGGRPNQTRAEMSERAVEYLESRDQLRYEVERGYDEETHQPFDVGEQIVRPYDYDLYNNEFDEMFPLDNILDAQDVLDNSGLSYEEFATFAKSGILNRKTKEMIDNSYELSPDRSNDIINQHEIPRDTLLKDGEDGFIRDKEKNNVVKVESNYKLIENIALQAVEKELDYIANYEERDKQRYELKGEPGKEFIEFKSKYNNGHLKEIQSLYNDKPNRIISDPTNLDLMKEEVERVRFISTDDKTALEGRISKVGVNGRKAEIHFIPIGATEDEPVIIDNDNPPLTAESIYLLKGSIDRVKSIDDTKLYQETRGKLSLIVEKTKDVTDKPYQNIVKELAQSAYPHPQNKLGTEHDTQMELDIRENAIDSIKSRRAFVHQIDNGQLDEMKKQVVKRAEKISEVKVKPYQFNSEKVAEYKDRPLYTVLPTQENGVKRFAIAESKLYIGNEGNQLVVEDKRFEKENQPLVMKAEGKFITHAKKDAMDLIKANYEVAALDPRFIEPLYESNSDLYKRAEDNKLPKIYDSLAYEPVRERTKEIYKEQQKLKELFKETAPTKKNLEKDIDLDF